MPRVVIQKSAGLRLDDIYRYSCQHWGQSQAERYLRGLFAAFEGIAGGRIRSRPIPAEFGVDGFVFRYERHFVYWKWLENGDIGIVTILHERMHRMDQFRADLSG